MSSSLEKDNIIENGTASITCTNTSGKVVNEQGKE